MALVLNSFSGALARTHTRSVHQSKTVSGSEKKSEQGHIKSVTRKFLEVSRCSCAKQRKRNVLKKCATRAKLFFLLLIRTIDFFGCLRWRRRLALHGVILYWCKL